MPGDYQSVLSHGLIIDETPGGCDYPAVGDVRDGTTFDSGALVGTLELPDEDDVREGVGYGEDGTEFTGTLVVSALVPISDTDTIHWRIKQAILNIILEMNLPGDATFGGIGQRVFSQLLPDEVGLQFPCVILTTEGQAEEVITGDSLIQRWRFPVRVWIADRESDRKHEKEGLYMAWRRRIIERFDQKAIGSDDVPEAEGSTVVTEVIFDPRLPDYQYLISGLVVWVSATLPR